MGQKRGLSDILQEKANENDGKAKKEQKQQENQIIPNQQQMIEIKSQDDIQTEENPSGRYVKVKGGPEFLWDTKAADQRKELVRAQTKKRLMANQVNEMQEVLERISARVSSDDATTVQSKVINL